MDALSIGWLPHDTGQDMARRAAISKGPVLQSASGAASRSTACAAGV